MAQKSKPVNRRKISQSLRFQVLQRDNFTCQYCGRKAPDVILHVDHIIPVSKGGTDVLENLVTACEACNIGKSDRELEENSIADKWKEVRDEILEKNQEDIISARKMLLHIEILETVFQQQFISVHFDKHCKIYLVKLINKYGFEKVLDSLKTSIVQYPDDANFAFQKIAGICFNKYDEKSDFILNKTRYLYGILRNKCRSGTIEFNTVALAVSRNILTREEMERLITGCKLLVGETEEELLASLEEELNGIRMERLNENKND